MAKNSTIPFWKYVKSRKQDNFGVAPLKERGHRINNSKEKARILIKLFSSVCTREKGKKSTKCLSQTEESIKTLQASQSLKME
jgi:hypothetical protein